MSTYGTVIATRVLPHENSVKKYQRSSYIEYHEPFHLNDLV